MEKLLKKIYNDLKKEHLEGRKGLKFASKREYTKYYEFLRSILGNLKSFEKFLKTNKKKGVYC